MVREGLLGPVHGSAGHAVIAGLRSYEYIAHTIRSRMREAGIVGLPGGTGRPGPYRFMPPKGYNPSQRLSKGTSGGLLDRFGNEWVRGPAHGVAAADGDLFEWDVQLSPRGILKWGHAAHKNQTYINVTRMGFISQ
jgi:Novel toxin 17